MARDDARMRVVILLSILKTLMQVGNRGQLQAYLISNRLWGGNEYHTKCKEDSSLLEPTA
jgi:hypothetical protein